MWIKCFHVLHSYVRCAYSVCMAFRIVYDALSKVRIMLICVVIMLYDVFIRFM